MHRTSGTKWRYQAHKSKMTAPRKRTVPQWQAFPNGMKCRGVTCEWKSMEHLRAHLERWLDKEWKSTVHLQARSWEWVDLQVKVESALASTFLRGEADLWVKVTSAFASTFLRGEVTSVWKSKAHLQARSWEWVDLRVEELWSSWWIRARRHRNKLCKSGNGTSRSSSRGGGEGRSWRGVVEAAVEVRLIILAQSRLLIYPRRLEEWQLGCFPGLWWTKSRAYGRAKECSGTQDGVVT